MPENRREEDSYEYWLACLHGVGNQKKRYLRERWRGAAELYNIEETRIRSEELLDDKEMQAFQKSRRNWKIKENYERFCEGDIRFIPYYSGEYPQKLKELPEDYTVYPGHMETSSLKHEKINNYYMHYDLSEN